MTDMLPMILSQSYLVVNIPILVCHNMLEMFNDRAGWGCCRIVQWLEGVGDYAAASEPYSKLLVSH